MAGARVTKGSIEALVLPTTQKARVTKAALDVLVLEGAGEVTTIDKFCTDQMQLLKEYSVRFLPLS